MPTPETPNMGLYYADFDRISVPQDEDEIANYLGVQIAAVRLMQANISQGRYQFKAIYDQISTQEHNNALQKPEIAITQNKNNDLMTKNKEANLLIETLKTKTSLPIKLPVHLRRNVSF